MKNIVRTDAILTRVTVKYNNLPKNGTIRNPKWSYFSYHVGNKIITSENSLPVNYMSQEGHHIYIWYVENNPKRVYRYKILALLFG